MIKKKAKERQAQAGKEFGNRKNSFSSTDPKLESKPFHTSDEVAKIAGTSGATVKRTKYILENGTDEQKERARKGSPSLM